VAYGFIRATVYETAPVTRTNGPSAYSDLVIGYMAATQRKTVGFLQRKIFLKLGSSWSPNFLLLSREITTWGRA